MSTKASEFTVKPTVNVMITPKHIKDSFFNSKLHVIKNKSITLKNSRKKLKCSPYSRINSIERGKTCQTKNSINKLVDEYNKSEPNNKIIKKNEKQMYNDLAARLNSKCKDEECLFDIISKQDEKEKCKKIMFAPNLEHKGQLALSTTNVREVLCGYEKIFPEFISTVSPINYSYMYNGKCVNETLCNLNLANLMKKGKTKIGVVFNIADSFNSGGHWIAMFIDLAPTNKSEKPFIYLFDSYGMGYMIKKEYENSNTWLNKFISEVKNQGKRKGIDFRLIINKTRHQVNDGICGVYALFVIITLLTRHFYGDENRPPMKLGEIEKLFKNHHISEKFMELMRITYFNE